MSDTELETIIHKSNLALEFLEQKFSSYYYQCIKLGSSKNIENIKYRLKTHDSIKKKVTNRLNLDLTIDNINDNVHDIAGARIICPFLSNVKEIIKYIENDPEIKIIEVKDYIKKPKASGYASYHMIVQVPINIDGKQEYTYAEIQIRTLAMDLVASLEHKLVYKGTSTPKIKDTIKKITKFIYKIDRELDNLYRQQPPAPLSSCGESLSALLSPEEYEKYLDLEEKYYQALLNVESIVNNIKQKYPHSGIYTPIEHIKLRIKPETSTISKLKKKNKEVILANIENEINDLSGMTIVCSFLSDAKEIIEQIRNQQDLIILEEKDYITKPKENGYTSYHFLVAVPVIINETKTYAKVEIQVRTTIMDFWNSAEHVLCYKTPENKIIKEGLKEVSSTLKNIEEIMESSAQIVKHQNTWLVPYKTLKKEKIKKENN